MKLRLHRLIGLLGLSLACNRYPEIIDDAAVCVTAVEVGGQHKLFVEADSFGCQADHKGASLECTISVDGSTARIRTVLQDGKDPDHSCAGPLETSCEVTVEPGSYTLEFDGEQLPIVVPGGEACFSYDMDTED